MPKKKPIIMFNNETIEDAYNLTEYSTTEASRPLINYCTGTYCKHVRRIEF